MKMSEKGGEALRMAASSNKMVVIWEDSPRFELPFVLDGQRKERVFEQRQPSRSGEEMLLVIACSRDYVDSITIQ